jgi:L-asparaginase II
MANPLNPILVERWRGDVLESFHRGVICMVDADGKVIFETGDIQQVCFPRSALKLFQIIPLLESGAVEEFGFTTEEIAIMCGSHNGENEHLRVVKSILKKIGLDGKELKCGAQYPTLTEDRNRLIKTDKEPSDLHNNCSGKHAGFLAWCVFGGYDTEGYAEASHPLHKAILEVTAEMHEYPAEKMTVALDGCSAPIFSLPVYNQAVGFKNLLNAERFGEKRKQSCDTVIHAMISYPFMIAGRKRYCTEMMELCGSRVFGKTGADGVYSLGFIEEKMGCTIKIDDGLMGPQYNVAQAILEKSGIFPEETLKKLRPYMEAPIINWAKKKTGVNKVSEKAFEGLKWPERVAH